MHPQNHYHLKRLIHILLIGAVLFFSLSLTGCSGKRAPEDKKVSFIPEHLKRLYIGYIVNYTQQFELDKRLRNGVVKFFNNNSEFTIVNKNNYESSDLYMVIHIRSFYFTPSYTKFIDAEPVNTRFQAHLEINVQTKPDPSKLATTYFNNRRIILTGYHTVEPGNSLKTYNIAEEKFFSFIGSALNQLLMTGSYNKEFLPKTN